MNSALRAKAIKTAWAITPPALWNHLTAWRGHPKAFAPAEFGHMLTTANPSPLVCGRFADIFNRHRTLDPFIADNATRYRIYNICKLAALCRHVPGDFVFAGVSFGVAPRVVSDFVDFPSLDKMMHLIDPFEGGGPGRTGAANEGYNRDIEYVRHQYPTAARIKIHTQYIPDALPLSGSLAFVSNNTGSPEAEAESIPLYFSQLSDGGIIVVDSYSIKPAVYDAAFRAVGCEPIWFPSGQAAIVKPR